MQVFQSSKQALETNSIDLWHIDPTQLSEQSLTKLKSLLNPHETEQLLHYRNKQAQFTALVTRAICRLILSQYTSEPSTELDFTRNQHGKPALKNNQQKIQFNLSHNNSLIVMAVCIGDDIGCDIESPLRKVSIDPITRRYFATQEHEQLCELTDDVKRQQFFKIWTLKEAFVKATGVGINLGLNSFYFEWSENAASEINILFNNNYPLNKQVKWQFNQQIFNQQMLAICRSSKRKQSINFIDAIQLINH